MVTHDCKNDLPQDDKIKTGGPSLNNVRIAGFGKVKLVYLCKSCMKFKLTGLVYGMS